MFGDKLNQEQCERLVERLKGCRQPFVCAHGRPSLVPLFVLTSGGRPNVKKAVLAGRRSIDWTRWKQRS